MAVINLPTGGGLVDKAGKWTTAMWAWMRDITAQWNAGGGMAPANVDYVVGVADPGLPNARVATSTSTVAVSIATPNVITWTVPDNAITFAKMQDIATQTLIGRNTAGTGDPESVTISQALDWLP